MCFWIYMSMLNGKKLTFCGCRTLKVQGYISLKCPRALFLKSQRAHLPWMSDWRIYIFLNVVSISNLICCDHHIVNVRGHFSPKYPREFLLECLDNASGVTVGCGYIIWRECCPQVQLLEIRNWSHIKMMKIELMAFLGLVLQKVFLWRWRVNVKNSPLFTYKLVTYQFPPGIPP